MSVSLEPMPETGFRQIKDYHHVFKEYTEGTSVGMFSVEDDVLNIFRMPEIVWRLFCPHCFIIPDHPQISSATTAAQSWHDLRRIELEILILNLVFPNSSTMKALFLLNYAPNK